MINRLIEATKLIFNCIYKEYGTLEYNDTFKYMSHYFKSTDEDEEFDIRAIVNGPKLFDKYNGYLEVDLMVYQPGTYTGYTVLSINIKYTRDSKSKQVEIPNPIDILLKVFNGLNVTVGSASYNVMLIRGYKEPTDVIDTILSSSPEELSLYLKLL